jgi:hypothetical protein
MTQLDETRGTAAFLVSEANGAYRSRDEGTVAAGSSPGLLAGTILGRTTIGAATAEAKDGNTGNATISAVTVGGGAKVGVYQVVFTAATTFDVIDPDGFKLPSGKTATAYADDLGFTITAGGTAMVAGDGFDITVAAGNGNYVAYDPDATTGAQTVAGILFEDAVGTVKKTVVTRDAEVNGAHLIYQDDADATAKATANAALAALGIIVR